MLLSALAATSCSNEEIPNTPTPNSELVELGITAGVSLTKSAIHSAEHKEFTSIAVFATGEGYFSNNNNNSAIYTKNSESGIWENNATNKIMLSNETATIYAIYPAQNGSNNNWTVENLPSSSSSSSSSSPLTIPISTFLGNSQSANTDCTITVPAATDPAPTDESPAKILSAPKDIDYMYGVDGSTGANGTDLAKASNKKENETDNSQVKLKMKHALAMVSFRIYNDGTYSGKGQLTEIKLSNASGSSGLNTGSNSTMNISSGAISVGSGSAATYTRVIKTDGTPVTNYYQLEKVANANESGDGSATAVKTAAAKFSILVFPLPSTETQADTDVKANTIQVTFKIDDVEHTVALAGNDAQTKINWAAGTNSLYTAKLSGKGLSITTVTVADWGETPVGSDLEVD